MSYTEKRVRVKKYGILRRKSPLLVEVPSIRRKPLKLHTLAAAGFNKMAEAVREDLGIELKAASCWRRHRWRSWEHYEAKMIAKFGSVKEGRRWVAYNSPHETGLAVDFGVGGLEPSRRTRKKQRKTPLHKWLVENAYRFGFHPYKTEPWHWEFPIGLKAWKSGDPDDVVRGDVPLSFGEEDDFDGVIEDEMFYEDAVWFSGEDGDDLGGEENDGLDENDDLDDFDDLDGGNSSENSDKAAISVHPTAALRLPRSGEVGGEIGIGEAGTQLRWTIRWKFE
ncbi:MAG: D-alanyl-D-alanine carboxypeptidase family protein [Nannocystaceae bacterium]